MMDDARKSNAELRDQLREVRLEVAKLTSELATLREERATERGAQVIDMPNPLTRRDRRVN